MNIPESLGWLGKRMRHVDGREGVVTAEFVGFGFVTLTIGHGATRLGEVTLANGRVSIGGWEWFCENFHGGPRWLSLGP